MSQASRPYSEDLAGREPLASLEESARRIELLTKGWTADQFSRSYAPGKWTGAQLLLHLVHGEMIFGARIRFGLTVSDYVVQPMEQDDLMAAEPAVDGAAARDGFLALRRVNLALFRSLSPDRLARAFSHPEYGQISAGWTIGVLAGHDWHHIPQLEAIARGA